VEEKTILQEMNAERAVGGGADEERAVGGGQMKYEQRALRR
tara:strand:- start:20 stop:142 length:123 start_codon:yes stop_codon:yes gene_type:complete